jgi:hypothetical protein
MIKKKESEPNKELDYPPKENPTTPNEEQPWQAPPERPSIPDEDLPWEQPTDPEVVPSSTEMKG